MPETRTAHLSLGGNIGDASAMLRAATARLAQTPGLAVVARSGLYRTPAWGETDQAPFTNAALALRTALAPHALLAACLRVETALGRVRGRHWGPRLIDIDIIAYEGVRVADDRLVLPHPHALERAFVLVPLMEIAPDLVIADVPIRAALATLDRAGIERVGTLDSGDASCE